MCCLCDSCVAAPTFLQFPIPSASITQHNRYVHVMMRQAPVNVCRRCVFGPRGAPCSVPVYPSSMLTRLHKMLQPSAAALRHSVSSCWSSVSGSFVVRVNVSSPFPRASSSLEKIIKTLSSSRSSTRLIKRVALCWCALVGSSVGESLDAAVGGNCFHLCH